MKKRTSSSRLLLLDMGTTHIKTALLTKENKLENLRKKSSPQRNSRSKSFFDAMKYFTTVDDEITHQFRYSDRKRLSVKGISITGQRSTLVIWDRKSGKILSPAISWMHRSLPPSYSKWIKHTSYIQKKTGLPLTPYYAPPKIREILTKNPALKKNKNLAIAPMPVYLLWRYTDEKIYRVEPTFGSRYLLLNLSPPGWSKKLIDLFRIPEYILPDIIPSVLPDINLNIGGRKTPVVKILGDQQASVMATPARKCGVIWINIGTGGFILCNTSSKCIYSKKLLTEILPVSQRKNHFLLEGTVHNAGSTIEKWAKKLKLKFPLDINNLKLSALKNAKDIFFLPGERGIGTPYYIDIDRDIYFGGVKTARKQTAMVYILEGIVYRIMENIEEIDKSYPVKEIHISGGCSGIPIVPLMIAGVSEKKTFVFQSPDATLRGLGYGVSTKKTSPVKCPERYSDILRRRYILWKKNVRKFINDHY